MYVVFITMPSQGRMVRLNVHFEMFGESMIFQESVHRLSIVVVSYIKKKNFKFAFLFSGESSCYWCLVGSLGFGSMSSWPSKPISFLYLTAI